MIWTLTFDSTTELHFTKLDLGFYQSAKRHHKAMSWRTTRTLKARSALKISNDMTAFRNVGRYTFSTILGEYVCVGSKMSENH